MEEHDKRIYLSPPHMSGRELDYVREAFDSNWVAPLGPNVDAFEREFEAVVGAGHAVAVSSGTAALHLALRILGIGAGDDVLVSTFTFCASVNPILYQNGTPVFIDSERTSWNLDPRLLAEELDARAAADRLPAAVVVVHIYGQAADMDPIVEACRRHAVPLIEDAAEALGADHRGRAPGTIGRFGVFSFNGNKVITTSGGGMLLCEREDEAERARTLATQAREPVPHYEHSEIGYNYRLSNVLAGIGRAQLQVLEQRVEARRRHFRYYQESLGHLPGLRFMPDAPWGRPTRWLTCITIDPPEFGADRDTVRVALERDDIEARPVWKPMHLQPVFRKLEHVGGQVAEDLFTRGLCLPSGSALRPDDLARIVRIIKKVHEDGA